MRAQSLTLTLVTLVAAFGGFLFGYDTAVINEANQYLKAHFGLTPFQAGQSGLPLLLGVLVFIAAFAMALGPISWIVCSEIFPTKLRGRAMSIATFTVWTTCYIVAQTFPILNDHPAIGPAKTFFVYGGA